MIRRVYHGQAHHGAVSPEYRIWCGMISRCENTRVRCYPQYGGRGIRVCERWRSDFTAFLADVGSRPSPKHSLDRIDVDGPYGPGNVRWITHREQCVNRRTTRFLTFRGETRCLADWAKLSPVSYRSFVDRIDAGWPIERALAEPRAGARA